MKISEQYFMVKNDGTINLGRFPSEHIKKCLEPSGTISLYYQRDGSQLIKKGIPDGVLFFGTKNHYKLIVDEDIFNERCICKVNVFLKTNNRYVMKIKKIED